MQKTFFLILLVLFSTTLTQCVMEKEKDVIKRFEKTEVHIDLPQILKEGTLTILVENSTTSYFDYRGKEMGFEYELLKLFADEIGVDLEVVVLSNLDNLDSLIKNGVGDLIACNYTITRERSKKILFSEPFLQTHQVLVQRKPEGWKEMKKEEWLAEMIHDPSELAQKEISVWKNSSYYQRLIHLQEEIGDTILIDGVAGNIGGEELIEMVAEGIIDYTVTEDIVAKVNQQFYDNIYTDLTLSVQQKIAFGMRKSSPLLKVKLDEWLTNFMKKSTFRYISKKYFQMKHITNRPGTHYAVLNDKHISKFDQYFKNASEVYGWDWRLLSSLCYQESKFNPDALSFGGAYGMMQFMPNTGPTYGVFPDSPPDVQIMGGAKKLAADYKFWMKIPDDFQRKKFSMASYNAGKGHILDAQRLAEKYGKNPLMWDDNVEVMLLNLSKKEYYQDEVVRHGMMKTKITYNYVRNVTERYLEWVSKYE